MLNLNQVALKIALTKLSVTAGLLQSFKVLNQLLQYSKWLTSCKISRYNKS